MPPPRYPSATTTAAPWTSTACATLLARNGVSPSIAQKLMRHSDIRLTMNTYTHLDLTDTATAVAALPGVKN